MRKILFQAFGSTPVWEFLPSRSIVKDYLQGDPAALRFFSPSSEGHLCEAVDGAHRPERKEVAGALLDFNRSIGAPVEALENIRRLGEENALVVLTGQQPGLLTGPLYTIYKALTAMQLAGRLSEEVGRPVVPAFWAATEDHDFEEVSAIHILAGDGRVARIGLPPEMGQGRRPMGSISIDQNVRLFLDRFLETLPRGGFREEVESCLSWALERSSSLGDWFSTLMSRLLGDGGLVMVDPCAPALKRLAAPLYHRALARPLEVTEMVNRAGDSLEETGYRRQIHKSDDLCPFFLLNPARAGVRENVRLRRESFHCASGTFSGSELRALLEAEPERFSPNAAMRPVVSDYLLPVITYVGGPGEIGYYAQLREVYDYFGLPMPRVRLRKGLTLIEPRTRRILEKLGVEPLELRDKEGLLGRLVRSRHGLVSESFWDERVAAVGRLLGGIRDDLAVLDPTLLSALDNTISSVSDRIRRFESKLLRNLRQRETLLRKQIEFAGEQVFPGGGLQERALNVFYFLAVYGWELLRQVKDSVPPEGENHHFVYIA